MHFLVSLFVNVSLSHIFLVEGLICFLLLLYGLELEASMTLLNLGKKKEEEEVQSGKRVGEAFYKNSKTGFLRCDARVNTQKHWSKIQYF